MRLCSMANAHKHSKTSPAVTEDPALAALKPGMMMLLPKRQASEVGNFLLVMLEIILLPLCSLRFAKHCCASTVLAAIQGA